MSKKIPLQNGMYAIVDKEDYERCMEHTWHLSNAGNKAYVYSNSAGFLSRFVLSEKLKENQKIIFNDRNTVNCQKRNLKIVNFVKVIHASSGRVGTSKYKGVSWHKQAKKWRAMIKANSRSMHLGLFYNEDEAAKAYNYAAKKHFGEHAFINKIGKNNTTAKENVETSEKYTRRRKNKLGFRGVTKRDKALYVARITINGNKNHLGTFDNLEQAAKAYDKKAYELYGDKAILNFPELISEYNKE